MTHRTIDRLEGGELPNHVRKLGMMMRVPSADGTTVFSINTDEILQVDEGYAVEIGIKNLKKIIGAKVITYDGSIYEVDPIWAKPVLRQLRMETGFW